MLILLLGGSFGMRQYDQAGGLMVAAKSAMVRLATIGVTVWLISVTPSARSETRSCFFAYVVNGMIAHRRRRNHLLFLASGRCRSLGCYRWRPPAHPADLSAVPALALNAATIG